MKNRKLNAWLLRNYRKLALKATQVHWTRDWMPGCFDLQVSIVLDGREHIGRGVDKDSDSAFAKAGAEALERAFCFEHNISTCGVAVHTNERLAEKNARNELVERDRFFCHYFTQTPFEEIDSDDYHHIREKLGKRDIVMKVFEMNPLNRTVSHACISKGERTGLVVGLGASREKSISMGKAVVECMINTLAALHEQVSPLNFGEFGALSVCRPEDHRRLYLGEKTLIEKNGWIWEGRGFRSIPEWLDEGSFRYSRLDGRHELLGESPVVAVKCENDFLQKSFYGEFKREHINFDRIGNFAEVADINRLPHPLG